jgi:stringent starvation protein B
MSEKDMLDQRPYMMEATRQWVMDSGFTPYLAAIAAGAQVPPQAVKNGKVILNLRPAGVQNYIINEHGLLCDMRFGGVSYPIHVPLDNILAIYAKENMDGNVFNAAQSAAAEAGIGETVSQAAVVQESEPEVSPVDQPTPRPGLRLIK